MEATNEQLNDHPGQFPYLPPILISHPSDGQFPVCGATAVRRHEADMLVLREQVKKSLALRALQQMTQSVACGEVDGLNTWPFNVFFSLS